MAHDSIGARLARVTAWQAVTDADADADLDGDRAVLQRVCRGASTSLALPSFTPRALDVGIIAVHALPMRLREQVIGGLNIFQSHREELDEPDVRVLQALADIATISLIQEQAISRAGVLTEQLQAALNSRVVVEQAKGATARAFGISVEDAFQLLRTHARTSRRRLTDVSHDVVTSPDGPRLLRPE